MYEYQGLQGLAGVEFLREGSKASKSLVPNQTSSQQESQAMMMMNTNPQMIQYKTRKELITYYLQVTSSFKHP